MLDENNDFYTPSGIQVFTKEPFMTDDIELDSVISKFESTLPEHIRDDVEMIIVGQFDEFEERGIDAFYKDGALHVSNYQTNNEDLLDDLVHESAHAIEEKYGFNIYGDSRIKEEFLRKRRHLHKLLWGMGYKVPESLFLETEYDEEFDMFLYEQVGYDKLAGVLQGLFINPYAATSLREYFATAFTEFYLHPDSHNFLSKVSPSVYKKLVILHRLNEA
jgi:hypothetical protein